MFRFPKYLSSKMDFRLNLILFYQAHSQTHSTDIRAYTTLSNNAIFFEITKYAEKFAGKDILVMQKNIFQVLLYSINSID